MKTEMHTLMFFLLLSLTLSLAVRPHKVSAKEPTGYNLITKTCENAVYRDLCITSLKAANGSQQADLKGLAKIAVKLAATNATDTSGYINQLLNSTSTDPSLQQLLNDCSENYMDAVDQLEDSVAALDSQGYSDVNTWVTAAMADAETCEDAFEGDSKNSKLLSDRNTIFSQLCSNALAITNILAGM